MKATSSSVLLATLALLAASACDISRSGRASSGDRTLGVGRVASAQEVAAWDVDVNPAGRGLPPGRGTAVQGAALFQQRCAVCHGAQGQGQGAFPQLIGRDPRAPFPDGRDTRTVRTIGNYWPYATTLYDYVHRAMPQTAPGSLSPDEVYALTAYLLARNAIISDTTVIDARTLPAIRMPARDHFVRDDRSGGSEFR